MNRQQPLALAPPAGDADWTERSLLDSATRRALGSINLAFLNLAMELAEEGRLKLISGFAAASDRFADRSRRRAEALRAACRTRFSICASAMGASGRARSPRPASVQDAESRPAADDRLVSFARAAIMLVWHLAQTRTAGARLIFGASPATIAAVAAMPVAAAEQLARRVAPALTARFGSRTRFWLQFEGCAVQPDDRAVNLLRQLGLQIQGAESARGQALQRRHRRGAAG